MANPISLKGNKRAMAIYRSLKKQMIEFDTYCATDEYQLAKAAWATAETERLQLECDRLSVDPEYIDQYRTVAILQAQRSKDQNQALDALRLSSRSRNSPPGKPPTGGKRGRPRKGVAVTPEENSESAWEGVLQ